jgi:hypothetical protein
MFPRWAVVQSGMTISDTLSSSELTPNFFSLTVTV